MKITYQKRQEIIEICKRYNINNYNIKNHHTVDVDSNFYSIYTNPFKLLLKVQLINIYIINQF